MADELHFDDPLRAAADPATDAEALRQLAYRYPETRAAVAAHPRAYRGLLDWLHQFGDPAVNAALEAREDYDGYIDSNGFLVMSGDVSGAVAGSQIRTAEHGMYVLGQGGVNSYSQVERTTPYSAVAGGASPKPEVQSREQVVAQVRRTSIFGNRTAGSGGQEAQAASASGVDAPTARTSSVETAVSRTPAAGTPAVDAPTARMPAADAGATRVMGGSPEGATAVFPKSGSPEGATAVFPKSASPAGAAATMPLPTADPRQQATRTMPGAVGRDSGGPYAAPGASPYRAPSSTSQYAPSGGASASGYPAAGRRSSYSAASTATRAPAQQAPASGSDYDGGGDGAAPKKRKGGPSALGIIFSALVIVAIALLAVVIYVFTRGFETPNSSPTTPPAAQAAPTTASPTTPSPSPSTTEAIRYPAPANAQQLTAFATPSGNISCSFNSTGVSCVINSNDWAAGNYASCSGSSHGTLSISGDSAVQSCGTSGATAATGLTYGQYAANGDYACSSTADGVSCWNTKSGASFALARGGWMTGSGGEIAPAQYSWNQ
ncbi:hypothetical protein QU668_10990 [Schaalia sp. HMT-877]|nr:hypothetical protein QU668_10990 [Schaalia sp. HMT-877]